MMRTEQEIVAELDTLDRWALTEADAQRDAFRVALQWVLSDRLTPETTLTHPDERISDFREFVDESTVDSTLMILARADADDIAGADARDVIEELSETARANMAANARRIDRLCKAVAKKAS